MPNKIFETISNLLPEDVREEVSSAIEAHLLEVNSSFEQEYQAKLDEAYTEFNAKLAENDAIGEEGYRKAFEMICDLSDRLERQNQEWKEHLESEFDVAHQMIESEKAKNEEIESDLQKAYEQKLKEAREEMVESVHAFLSLKGDEYYSQARREMASDPKVVEHKLAFEKILETAADYLTDDDYIYSTNSKLDNLAKELEQAKIQLSRLESKNTRLVADNEKLTESFRKAQGLLTEAQASAEAKEKKERLNESRNAEGKGRIVSGKVEVIAEAADEAQVVNNENDNEIVQEALANAWMTLAGLKD